MIDMKKRRGKQPVKPDLEEAMKERVISLKGKQNSTMNIPIIYRRTFGWDDESVIFHPVNKRSFVVFSGDVEDEEIDTANFVERELDISELPWYSQKRKEADDKLASSHEELKEYLVSLSLTDRYVNILIPPPSDPELDNKLRSDLELISRDLGCSYTSTPKHYLITFVFPRHDNSEIVRRSSVRLNEAIRMLRDFVDEMRSMDIEGLRFRVSQLEYSVDTLEAAMDSLYTESLNVLWDLPQVERAGHFIIVQSCERAMDEIQFIMRSSGKVIELLESEGGLAGKLFREEFDALWSTSVAPALDSLDSAIDMARRGERESVEKALVMIRDHRVNKEMRSFPQDRFQSQLTGKIEREASKSEVGNGMDVLSMSSSIESIEHLFGINQAAQRLENLSQIIATKVLYLENSALKHD
mgnify:CR=1 FL=1